MLFNSFDFLVFLPVVFMLYWFVFQKSLKLQNIFILIASYVFYGWWDWRFLSLIAFSSLVDYILGLKLGEESDFQKRKILLGISVVVNLGLLGFFKYFNFFIDSTIQLINTFGFQANPYSLQLILPVGISFYTFQTMSYTIDIYRRQLEATRDPIAFFAFVSFFPQLVAGPIERASNLLAQFEKTRNFDFKYGYIGLKLVVWGLFKKVVIADNAAIYVNEIFFDYIHRSSFDLIIGAVFFGIQIYGDFSGYSDIAIGLSRIFGFKLMTNFKTPYFSRDIAEFWRRWHISLSTWFRDYVYIPLGGSKVSKFKAMRNTVIVFVISGFWHGANWTFIFWGLLNAIYFIPLLLANKTRRSFTPLEVNNLIPGISETFNIGLTFFLTTTGWIFFRSESINQAFNYLRRILMFDFTSSLNFLMLIFFSGMVLIWTIVEWIFKNQSCPFQEKNALGVDLFYGVLVIGVLTLGPSNSNLEFIYFQF